MFGSSFESEKGTSLSRKSKIALFAFFDGVLSYSLTEYIVQEEQNLIKKKITIIQFHILFAFLRSPAQAIFFMIIVIERSCFYIFLFTVVGKLSTGDASRWCKSISLINLVAAILFKKTDRSRIQNK